jgi:hypothetical protein
MSCRSQLVVRRGQRGPIVSYRHVEVTAESKCPPVSFAQFVQVLVVHIDSSSYPPPDLLASVTALRAPLVSK